jgi:hypothetical protein
MSSTTAPSTIEQTSSAERASSRDRVGTFATLDGAARAVSHLVELDYDPATVAIAPQGYATVEPQRLRDRIGPAVVRSVARTTVAVAAVTIVISLGIDTLVGVVAPAVAIAAAAGAILGLLAAIHAHRRASFLAVPDVAPTLRPTTFDVLVDRAGASARHDLARWWDPLAPPARRAA